ncbi:MAG: hypothetical protein GXX99_02285 [Clostridiales bacterium]|nr:hypothetical protein [Clostridiales bacterium]
MFRIDRRLVNVENFELIKANASAPSVTDSTLVAVLSMVERERLLDARQAELEAQLARLEQDEADLRQRMRQSEEEARRRLEQAGAEAKRVRLEAEVEAVEIHSQARHLGYSEGLQNATREADARLQAARAEDGQAVGALLAEIARARSEAVEGLEAELIELVFAVARKIVNVAIQKDDIIYESLVKNALSQITREGKITVRVSTGCYERLFPEGSATFVLGDESIAAAIVNDPLLPEGGCMVESDGETINAGVDSQLKYISIAFRQADKSG